MNPFAAVTSTEEPQADSPAVVGLVVKNTFIVGLADDAAPQAKRCSQSLPGTPLQYMKSPYVLNIPFSDETIQEDPQDLFSAAVSTTCEDDFPEATSTEDDSLFPALAEQDAASCSYADVGILVRNTFIEGYIEDRDSSTCTRCSQSLPVTPLQHLLSPHIPKKLTLADAMIREDSQSPRSSCTSTSFGEDPEATSADDVLTDDDMPFLSLAEQSSASTRHLQAVGFLVQNSFIDSYADANEHSVPLVTQPCCGSLLTAPMPQATMLQVPMLTSGQVAASTCHVVSEAEEVPADHELEAAADRLAAVVEDKCGWLRIRGHGLQYCRASRQRPGRQRSRTQRQTLPTLRFYVTGLPWAKRAKWEQPLLWSVSAVLQKWGATTKMKGGELSVLLDTGDAVNVEFAAART
eukprot:gnl/TRDRNA2_/TRDRNA2_38383_c0_seq2.p1 gnl/TRDRNA2_/TRDRNA2_38383_c0~~gnl/TRDRNA2_/TRDRNA2_38383_c0_seq2.p1  ORF type:complete len:430 (-),score=80.49 gnl/TRDRNA2_/TRDRNA2_38383_c0_seq2:134-1354(-)